MSEAGKYYNFPTLHNHPIKIAKWDEKSNSAYSGGFSCNMCRTSSGQSILCYYCAECSYDCCEKCFNNENDKQIEALIKQNKFK